MASSAPVTTHTQSQNYQDKNYSFALTSLTTLFFMWGFITCLNDILIPHLKAVFNLTYVQAMLVQFCFFGAYFLMSLPSGYIVKKVGYKKGIVIGLLIAAVGCILFYPAASLHSYPVFLFALFVLASGITLLQVSANPYVSLLGSPKTASSRLTLTQAFNALGTTVAPSFGALLILDSASEAFLTPAQNAESVQLPYLLLAAMLILLAGIFAWLKLPDIMSEQKAEAEKSEAIEGSAWQYRHLVLGAVGIFMYVGAEVAIGSFLVSFLAQENIAGLKENVAAHYITYYFGGAMVGRFIGAAVMQKLPAGKVLGFNATMAIILVIIAMSTSGQLAMWSILLVGLFNSIMFPTIFSLALNGLGKHTAQGSGILCLAIVGGAIVPLLQGALADSVGVQLSYVLPILCYIFIVFYGLRGSKPVLVKEPS
ncbi:sugar MFS transporter [Pseudoalteromonas sp. B28]|jgi:FHS family L-fucose permease-like MFS transporter|uniref:Sugar MFS transporter n=1 Tax=Pseudoalteromonas distincta TaxID=77608 RepID=A0ABT9GJP6_9GAMM|nr:MULTISPECIES: sugar MFS transporter [Pseudoalteromonas]EGI73365.1 glucose/galactose transporter family protein [Pseudoalteromonas distincta]KHM48772.1 major facilitator transporter [Pseudoalteromonas elyakovii]KID38908.1 major facilitator transporter [Pseudoalteromonas distincta]MBB1345672.1 sugar MFS transporter [Pseudoalteromonas sp. SG45-2]MBE3672905.1 MFS transporter, FHS family, L-fucose permease [Pseudoalteromonas distincta KMM 3548]